VISNDDKALEQPNKETDNKEVNGTVLSSTSDKLGRGGIDVRAVITIRKKMKEKINEKIEDQWEYFINGIGRGISIQLVSEEIDPGNW
jgi:lipoxygenase